MPPTPQSEPAPIGAILINQHGFLRDGPKKARMRRAGAPLPFVVLNDRDQVVFQGTTRPIAGIDPQSGLPLHAIDFSDYNGVGEGFTLRVGANRSAPFTIGGRPYAALARDSLNYFYQARAGEAVEALYVPASSPSLARAAGHRDSTYPCFSGSDLRGTDWPGCDYELTVRRGWYDAGDYGQYAINTAWASWMLLNMAERAKNSSPRLCRATLGDRSLPMPEAGNGQADLLDEARVGIDNLLSLQIRSTRPQAVAKGAQLTTGPLRLFAVVPDGMVHHKVHGVRWPGDDILPATDTIPRRLYPPTTSATLALAGVGAQCARIFRGVDSAYARTCLNAAERAFAAAERVPDAYAWGEFDGGGPYDDRSLSDEFGWAATELWLATGKADYAAAMDRYVPAYDPFSAFDWRSVEARGMLSLATQDRLSGTRADAARAALQDLADRYVEEGTLSHFGLPYADTNFYWGSNGQMMNRAMILGSAYERSGNPAHKAAVIDAMDYLLGRNALSRSFISGYGELPMRNPHHRFWRGGEDPTRPFPPPGALSGGPNNVDFIDPVGSTLRGQCTGMTCWRDVYASYSMNEVTINWNGSLAWTAHWLDRQSAKGCEPVRDTTGLK